MSPPDPILGTAIAYKKDNSPYKINLGIGAYRTNKGTPYVFKVVKEAEKEILEDESIDKEYLPIDGLPELKPYVYLSNPTWANHHNIFGPGVGLTIREYPYWDPVTKGVDFEGLTRVLREAPLRSAVVLHACAHNPTEAQCELLTSKWHVYLLKNGRISMAGINEDNVDYLVEAIDDVVRQLPSS
ncbi:aspartate aminotransferase, putative [Eimeria maxima]|uniref:Aspartate aminotransferase, putative n=1 Tax=Eimeria maxima TaxID=5804 RepID=U6M217_EIMMA|nr:aspartate aminotransferase, putative [Eimeria maxima]CDJ56504.1 aspartate aminotransferase, putative [Eimeria maxima]